VKEKQELQWLEEGSCFQATSTPRIQVRTRSLHMVGVGQLQHSNTPKWIAVQHATHTATAAHASLLDTGWITRGCWMQGTAVVVGSG
jgi:hypothetical protein